MSIKIGFIIPTLNRPADMRVVLGSLRRQSVRCAQIVVVDASETPVTDVIEEFPDLPLKHVIHRPPSLTKQRNRGIAALDPDIDVAGFLDDDLELDADAVEALVRFWSAAGPTIGGTSMCMYENPDCAGQYRLERLFLLDSRTPGRVLSSGWPTRLPNTRTTIKSEWLYGGATVWRREVLERYSFEEFYDGYGYFDDVDFSYRVSRDYDLYMLGDARTHHYSRPMRNDRHFIFGRQQIFNWLHFVGKFDHFNRMSIIWSGIGLVVINLYQAVRAKQGRLALQRVAGNVVGLLDNLRGREHPVGGLWK